MTRAQFHASDSEAIRQVEEISDVQTELLGGYNILRHLWVRVLPRCAVGSARLCPVVCVGQQTQCFDSWEYIYPTPLPDPLMCVVSESLSASGGTTLVGAPMSYMV